MRNSPSPLDLPTGLGVLTRRTGLNGRNNPGAIGHCVASLDDGAIDRPERQRTLRATIEWSHDLLPPESRATFRRPAVFRGSFTLEGADPIAAAPLDQVEALVDQSLLKSIGGDRFFLRAAATRDAVTRRPARSQNRPRQAQLPPQTRVPAVKHLARS
jgi:hypothetical protein